jgi:hypothetical protein
MVKAQKIIKIQRVQNRQLYAHYYLTKKAHSGTFFEQANLSHGPRSEDNLNAIVRQGFDIAKSHTGPYTYFGTYPMFSDSYAYVSPQGIKCHFFCHVLLPAPIKASFHVAKTTIGLNGLAYPSYIVTKQVSS